MSKWTSEEVRKHAARVSDTETIVFTPEDDILSANMLTDYAERIAEDEAAAPVAYRFLGPDGEAVTEWDDTPITDKTFPDLCPPVGSVQHAYLHPPAQPPIELAAIREVIADLRCCNCSGNDCNGMADKLSRALGDTP